MGDVDVLEHERRAKAVEKGQNGEEDDSADHFQELAYRTELSKSQKKRHGKKAAKLRKAQAEAIAAGLDPNDVMPQEAEDVYGY